MDQKRSLEDESLFLSPPGSWQGFAHPEHKAEELEPLLRTLRFASIQLNKFWVEFNSFPVFMNEMKGASIRQIERLFDWFQAAPSWSSRVSLPRLVPELCSETSRTRLLDFTSRVVRSRMIRDGVANTLGHPLTSEAALADAITRLGAAQKLVQQLGLTPAQGTALEVVDALIQDVGERLERNGKVQAFFARLSTECGLGTEAAHAAESNRVFQAVDLIRHTPQAVWQWRRPQSLAPQNRPRMLAWQERSRVLVEARKRLEPCFKMEERVAAAQLRLLAEKLQAGGWFKRLGSSYKDALKRFRELEKPLTVDIKGGGQTVVKRPRQTPPAMAAQLIDWADYLEQRAQVQDGAEPKALFSPHFKGIDTAFEAALEANAWAASIRQDLESEDKGSEADFCSRLAESLFGSPPEKLIQAVEACSGAPMQAIQAILARAEYASGREFAAIGCDEEARWLAATDLRAHLTAIGVLPGVKLSELSAMQAAVRDLQKLHQEIETAAEARVAFKHAFQGEKTDLDLLSSAQDYIDFVSGSGLSAGLKASFLTAHGPQRLHDTRALVAPALSGLALVKEHLRRLEVATHGQSRKFEDLPLLDLIQRIQVALKHPSELAGSVQMMQSRVIQ